MVPPLVMRPILIRLHAAIVAVRRVDRTKGPSTLGHFGWAVVVVVVVVVSVVVSWVAKWKLWRRKSRRDF
jgi:hypothetical protein